MLIVLFAGSLLLGGLANCGGEEEKSGPPKIEGYFVRTFGAQSNTFAIGERTVLLVHKADPSKWPSWCGPGGLGIGSTVSSSVAVALNHPTVMHSFSSAHPGGAQFLFVDGSVRFIPNDIASSAGGVSSSNGTHATFVQAADLGSVGVYQLLGVKNDGQPIAEQY